MKASKTPPLPKRHSAAWKRERQQFLDAASMRQPEVFWVEVPAKLHQAVKKFACHYAISPETVVQAALVAKLAKEGRGA